MNKRLESFLYRLGRLRGAYQSGISALPQAKGADAPLTDPTAWTTDSYWGRGLLKNKGKPTTERQMIDAFTSWVYICVHIKASGVASVPLRLYVAKKEKGQKFHTIETKPVSKAQMKWLTAKDQAHLYPYLMKAAEVEEVTDSKILDVLRSVNPNPAVDQMILWETTSIFLDLTGDCYWYVNRNRLKTPKQIWVIPSQYIRPLHGDSLEEPVKGYEYRRGKTEHTFSTSDIIHFAHPNPKNHYTGFSSVQGVADAVFVNSKMYEFEEAVFRNEGKFGNIIETSDQLSAQETGRLQESMREKAGTMKAGDSLILPPGLKVVKDRMTPRELNYIEGRQLVREEISAAFDVPIAALVSDNVNRANAEVADYRLAKDGIRPRCKRIEVKLNRSYVPMFDRSNRLFLAFDNCVPEDQGFLHTKQMERVEHGIDTRDEARAEEGKEPRGGMADELLVDNRLVPLSMVGQVPAVPGQVNPDEEAEKIVAQVQAKIREKLL